jgi:hypothetical protein
LEAQLRDGIVRRRSRLGRRPAARSVVAIVSSSVAALAVAAFAVIAVHSRSASPRPRTSGGQGALPASHTCHEQVRHDALPTWARAGFSPPTQRIPHILGTDGEIAAILFADPLRSPPPPDHRNKILWVSRASTRPGSALRITAQHTDGRRPVGPPVTRTVRGGPGPSIVDLPSPGCWALTLRWSGHVDHLDLEYRR